MSSRALRPMRIRQIHAHNKGDDKRLRSAVLMGANWRCSELSSQAALYIPLYHYHYPSSTAPVTAGAKLDLEASRSTDNGRKRRLQAEYGGG